MTSAVPNHPLFLERQSALDQPIAIGTGVFLIVVFALPGVSWLVAIVGVGYLAFLWSLMLITTVEADHLEIRYRPFARRRIGRSEIAEFEVVTYRPVREWGGWGIRMRGADRAYTMSGNRAVKLKLTDGNSVLVGSHCPELLHDALIKTQTA
ncbi:MAG: hypothetical protein AAGG65_14030 [Pseudomonadota bacterium]